MAFKEKEVPDMLLATKGQVGETSEGFRQSLGTGFTQPIHPSYTHQLKLETQQSIRDKDDQGYGLGYYRKNGISD